MQLLTKILWTYIFAIIAFVAFNQDLSTQDVLIIAALATAIQLLIASGEYVVTRMKGKELINDYRNYQ